MTGTTLLLLVLAAIPVVLAAQLALHRRAARRLQAELDRDVALIRCALDRGTPQSPSSAA